MKDYPFCRPPLRKGTEMGTKAIITTRSDIILTKRKGRAVAQTPPELIRGLSQVLAPYRPNPGNAIPYHNTPYPDHAIPYHTIPYWPNHGQPSVA